MSEIKDGLIGQKIGNYEIRERLGKGGMAAVYLGENPIIGREVAIKVLAKHLAEQPSVSDRFISEARAVTRLRHPGIIEIYDFGVLDDGIPYYVMERLRGQELKDVMNARGKMPPAEVLPYLQQICLGLQAAHDGGIVHRDLKPANIFVLEGEPMQLKLLDFGIAKMLEQDDAASQTATGMVIGTPHFIAPEQAAGEREMIGPCTDIYTLGVIIYWMLCGELPFAETSVGMLLVKHISEPPPPLHQKIPDLDPRVAAVVHRCLEKAPMARPATPMELLSEFSRAVLGEDASGRAAQPATQSTAEITGPHLAGAAPPPVTEVALPTPAPLTADPPGQGREAGSTSILPDAGMQAPDVETRILEQTSEAPLPTAGGSTEIGSLSQLLHTPAPGSVPQAAPPLTLQPASGLTTMGGATGEVTSTAPGREQGARKPGLLIAAVATALALVGGGAYMMLSGGGQPSVPEVAAALPAASEPAPAPSKEPPKPAPVAAGGERAAAAERHNLKVNVAGKAARCRLTPVTGGTTLEAAAPCDFSVEAGQKLQLEVAGEGIKTYNQVWSSGADLELKLHFNPESKELRLGDGTEEEEPASKTAAATVEEPAPKTVRKPAARPRPAPTRSGKPRRPARPRKKPRRAGEDVVDITL